MCMNKNWSELYKKYKGLWVALKSDETTVIASGKDLASVKSKALKTGYEKPVFTKVPKKTLAYIGNF